MSPIRRFDHVGITVRDLDAVTAFFVGLGFETEGRTVLEGEFLDTVVGIPNCRTEIVMLRPPDGGTGLELSRFIRPNHGPGSPDPMPNEPGLRNVTFEVDDLQAILDRLAADGYRFVGGVGLWRIQASPEGHELLVTGSSTVRNVIDWLPPVHPDHAPHHPGHGRPGHLRGHRRRRPHTQPTVPDTDQPRRAATARPATDPADRDRGQTPVQPAHPRTKVHRPPPALVSMATPPSSPRPLVPPPSSTHMIRSRSTAALLGSTVTGAPSAVSISAVRMDRRGIYQR
jgi:catechol 2,3-dioxygenase-like lactoylglutathione lyase family enzyme